MGRPLNKKFFGAGSGDHFVVLAKVGEDDVATAEIIEQTGTKRFVVETENATGVCVLVDKDSDDLAAGEMLIQATNADDETQNVKVIKGRTAVLADGTIHAWSFDAAANARVQVIAGEVESAPVITITNQPGDVSDVTIGASVHFYITATATEDATPTYQWQSAPSGSSTFTDIDGATGTEYDTPAVSEDDSGLQVRCVVSATGAESVISNVATLTVRALPVITITSQPESQTVNDGESVDFTVEASVTEDATLSYEWQSRIGEGAWQPNIGNEATYHIAGASSLTTGTVFHCIVSATGGAEPVTSDEATLTVNNPG